MQASRSHPVRSASGGGFPVENDRPALKESFTDPKEENEQSNPDRQSLQLSSDAGGIVKIKDVRRRISYRAG
jgi:hypothetical protein